MSLSWREYARIRMKKKQGLNLSEQDKNTVEQNIGHFCRLSDEMIRQEYGEDANINKTFDEMSEEEKDSHTMEVIREGLARLKKKKKNNPEQEEEESETSMLQQKQQAEKIQNENNTQTSRAENP